MKNIIRKGKRSLNSLMGTGGIVNIKVKKLIPVMSK